MSGGPWQRVLEIVRRQADPDAHGPLADERLLARFSANGDPSAFELLVWRHGGLVLGTCRRLLSDAHLAEDAFQAAFLALAKKPRAVRSGAALADWLHRVAVRVSIKMRTTAIRHSRNDRVAARSVAFPPDDAGRNEWNEIVDHEIDRLPERLRRAVVLCYLDGRTTEEASKLLDCPRGTVLSRLSTARERLRVSLTRRGVTLPAAGVVAFVVSESPAALVPIAVRTALIETPPVLLAIVHGVFHAMTISKIKVATAVVLAIGFAGTGVGWVVVSGPGPGVVQADEPAGKSATRPKGLTGAEAKTELDKTLELLLAARKALEEKLMQAEQEYQEFRLKNPFLLDRHEVTKPFVHFQKIKAKRSDNSLREAEIQSRLHFIRDALVSAKDADAKERSARTILVKLHLRGVDVEALRKTISPDKPISAMELVQTFTDALQSESDELHSLNVKLEEMLARETKMLRDLSNYEVIDERLRRNITSNQALFDSLVRRANEIIVLRDAKK